jgi:signal transduction histidine kinase
MQTRIAETFEVQDVPRDQWLEVHVFQQGDGIGVIAREITAHKQRLEWASQEAFIQMRQRTAWLVEEAEPKVRLLAAVIALQVQRVEDGKTPLSFTILQRMQDAVTELNSLLSVVGDELRQVTLDFAQNARIMDVGTSLFHPRLAIGITTVDFNVLVQEVIGECLAVQEGKARAGTISWTIGALPTVQGDRAKLKGVLSVLIENALTFSRERQDARIDVQSTETLLEHRITVRDNGIGFDPASAERVFELFPRVPGHEALRGTGTQLAFVHQVVTKLNGRVWATAEPGQGAAFTFTLPK